MKRSLNVFLMVLVLVVPTLALGAGGQGETEKPVISIIAQVTSINDGVNAVFAAAEQDLGIVVDLETIPSSAEGVNIIRSRIAADDLPDIIIFNAGALMQTTLNPERNLISLNGQPFLERFDNSYLDTVSMGNNIYGVPVLPANFGGIIYNRKVFSSLGLSIPKTWDEFLKTAQKVKNSGTGIVPVLSTLKNTWTSQMIPLADFYNVANSDRAFTQKYSNNEANYSNHPAAARSFEKLEDLAQEGLVNSDQFSTSYDDGMQMIAEGKGAMWPMLTQVIPIIAANYPEGVKDLGIFAIPGDDPTNTGLTVWMPNSFYVTKAAKNTDVIMKFLDYYTSEEALSIFMSSQVLGGALLEKNAPAPTDILPIVKDIMVYQENGRTEPALEFQSNIKGANLQQICASVLNGDMTASEGAAEADKDISKQAIQLGIPAWANK